MIKDSFVRPRLNLQNDQTDSFVRPRLNLQNDQTGSLVRPRLNLQNDQTGSLVRPRLNLQNDQTGALTSRHKRRVQNLGAVTTNSPISSAKHVEKRLRVLLVTVHAWLRRLSRSVVTGRRVYFSPRRPSHNTVKR